MPREDIKEENIIRNFTVVDPRVPSNNEIGVYYPQCACEITCVVGGCTSLLKCFYREFPKSAGAKFMGKNAWHKPAWRYQSYINHFAKFHDKRPKSPLPPNAMLPVKLKFETGE